MKIAIACCLGFAVMSASAFADMPKGPQQQLYRFNGKACTADESKNIQPQSTIYSRNLPSGVRGPNPWESYAGCRTKYEWKLVDAAYAAQRHDMFWRFSNSEAQPTSHESDAGLP